MIGTLALIIAFGLTIASIFVPAYIIQNGKIKSD